MVEVEVINLTKIFGKNIVAVDNLSVKVRDKEFLAILGPSGCGKTTTLRCIAGLETPTKGEIYIGGTLVNYVPPKDRDVAMVFQSYALYPHMNVFNNIAFPLKVRYSLSKDEIKRRVEEVAKLLGIEHLLERMPKELSGGERQRVALGRAIIRSPKVFLMDEPLSNLDAKLRVQMRAELKRLQKDLEITTIYVTHDQVEAMSMADRILLMNKGRMVQLGSPEELYNHPTDLFAAGFIGTPPMNFIECDLKEGDGEFLLDAGDFSIKIPKDLGEMVKERCSSGLVLGIRPEDVLIHKEREAALIEGIEGEVYVVEPLGPNLIVNVKIGGYLIKVTAPSNFKVTMGEKLRIAFNIDKVHIFDRKSGKAII